MKGAAMPNRISHYLLSILCIGCIIFLISRYGIQLYQVSGRSMEPTYSSGSFLLVQKFGMPERVSRFDVVTIRSKNLGNRIILKRVIGLPGETVQILDGTVYIDGAPLSEPSFLVSQNISDPGKASAPIVLGDNEYFVLGDNRPESIDSRSDKVGLIPADSITGKVINLISF